MTTYRDQLEALRAAGVKYVDDGADVWDLDEWADMADPAGRPAWDLDAMVDEPGPVDHPHYAWGDETIRGQVACDDETGATCEGQDMCPLCLPAGDADAWDVVVGGQTPMEFLRRNGDAATYVAGVVRGPQAVLDDLASKLVSFIESALPINSGALYCAVSQPLPEHHPTCGTCAADIEVRPWVVECRDCGGHCHICGGAR